MDEKNLNVNATNSENLKEVKKSSKSKKVITGLVCVVVLAGAVTGVVLNKDKIFNLTKESQTSDTQQINNNSNTQSKSNLEITVNKEEVSFVIPESWKDTYKIEESNNKFGKQYTIKNQVNGKEVTSFNIAINTEYSFGESSWGFLGYYNDKKVYTMQNFVCRYNDGNNYNDNDYKHEKEVENVLKTIKIKNTNNYNYFTISTDEFELKMPKALDSKAYLYEAAYKKDIEKLQISEDKNAKYYIMDINTDGKLSSTKESFINAFVIMITENDTYLESSWTPIGKNNGKNVLVMKKFVCRDNDGNTYSQADYDLEKQIDEIIKSIIIR